MTRLFWNTGLSVGVALSLALGLTGTSRAVAPATGPADDLVRQALRAEVDNQPQARSEWLNRALESTPEHGPARWHSGYVRVGDEWLTLDEAQRRAAESPGLASYRQLRDNSPDSAAGHMALALLCRKQGLPDRERVHWANVLRFQADNKEAIRSLGLRKYRNMWLTRQEIQLYEELARQYDDAKSRWQPMLKRLRRSLESRDDEERRTALAELQAINQAEAIPFLEAEFFSADESLQREVVNVLGKIDHQAATLSLLRWALLPDAEQVREAAAELLKLRPMFSYMPMLIGNLAAPVEFSYYVDTYLGTSGGTRANVTLFREGPLADYSLRSDFVMAYTFPPGSQLVPDLPRGSSVRILPPSTEPQRLQVITDFVAAGVHRAMTTAASVGQTVGRENARTAAWNTRVFEVLKRTTGQELGDRPQSWWKWWVDYNELYRPKEKPLIERTAYSYSHVECPPLSCFMPGTLVWTETGPVAIEKLRVGDRVLSQDPGTGELAYKVVIGTTVRPPSSILRMNVGGSEVHTTRGHLFWKVGEGWAMAKQLKEGDRLHGAGGAVTLDKIEDYAESPAHNLIVDGFATYFVGQPKLLVHDNTARQVTTALVPGLLP